MTSMTHVESDFAHALLDASVQHPVIVRGGERRFAVYRNNVAMGLVAALSSRYPVVRRLVGGEFFGELCRQYVAAEPPRSPILLYYGETFPAFVEAFEPARSIPYLAGVARIELARGLAYHSVDAEAFGGDAFAMLDPGTLASLKITLHPSVSIITSRYPIYSIWKVNQRRSPVVPVSPWAPEDVVVARPHYAVQVHKLGDGQAAFLRALAGYGSFAEAIVAARGDETDFDVAGALAMLIETRIVTAFDRRKCSLRVNLQPH